MAGMGIIQTSSSQERCGPDVGDQRNWSDLEGRITRYLNITEQQASVRRSDELG